MTAILPCGNTSIDTTKTPRQNIGNGIDSFVLASWYAVNGCGEMTGTHWIEESGFLEGPIMLTNTCSVGTVRDAVIQFALNQVLPTAKNDPSKTVDPDYGLSLMLPIVAETYDGWLNNILTPAINYQAVAAAINNAKQYTDPNQVEEGNYGGGTGMTCYDWKGGIGTASRTNIQIYVYDQSSPPKWIVLKDPTKPKDFPGYTVGVLVQANQGTFWDLVVRGVPVGTQMTPPGTVLADDPPPVPNPGPEPLGGPPRKSRRQRKSSIIVVIATDAPLIPSQLKRLARRAAHGIARTGTITNDDSGELVIAFSTANQNSFTDPNSGNEIVGQATTIPNDAMDPLFEATVNATEEAIINAVVVSDTMTGRAGHTAWRITDANLSNQPGFTKTLIEVMQEYNRFKSGS